MRPPERSRIAACYFSGPRSFTLRAPAMADLAVEEADLAVEEVAADLVC
jgi:hypothetical protein